MSHRRERDIRREWDMAGVRRTAPEPTRSDGNRAIHQIAVAYAEQAPLEAAAAYAAGLMVQPRGGRVAALARVVDLLSEADPASPAAVVNRLLADRPQPAPPGEAA